MATIITPIDPTPPSTILPPNNKGRGPRSLLRGLNWFYPGIKVKRYLALIPMGIVLVLVGFAVLLYLQTLNYLDSLANLLEGIGLRLDSPWIYLPLGSVLVLLGLWSVSYGLFAAYRSIVSAIAPEIALGSLPEVIRRKQALSQGAKIVVIGGGTGLSTLLRCLKQYTANLTAVVTMTDDGGSSGQLQRQLPGGVLPPGDIRNCLVALADVEPTMQQLFQYRFKTVNDTDGLSGHNFGNLLIAAMADITGDYEKAIEETSRVLAIRGRVLPSTVEQVVLVGEMEDGAEITGETRIANDPRAIVRIKLCPAAPKPIPRVIEAIRQADIIVMGPGSVFTSVIPNLLVKEIADAVAHSKAPLKLYVCNVMTQRGETDGYTASDHVRVIEKHVGRRVFDHVFVNTARPSDETLERYKKYGAEFVEPDIEAISDMGYVTAKGKFMNETEVVRHDSEKLAHDILVRYSEVQPRLGRILPGE